MFTSIEDTAANLLGIGHVGTALALLVSVGLLVLLYRTSLRRGWRRIRETQRRVLAEDALKHIHNGELRGLPATPDSLAGALGRSQRVAVRLIVRMEARGWLRSSADGLSLTAEGTRLALQVIRAHRLWERYLVDEARMPLADVHAVAERREHRHSREQLDALDAAMGYPETDPHGDPIPNAAGELHERSSRPVLELPLHRAARIVHLEDEPPAVFAQIAAEGFRPGQMIWVVESDSQRVVLSDGEEEHVVAPIVAANIFVALSEEPMPRRPVRTLASLKPGRSATILGLDDALQGLTRRRLLDLGLTPGTGIVAEMASAFQDPVAYRVRESLVALRREQAECVLIETPDRSESYDV